MILRSDPLGGALHSFQAMVVAVGTWSAAVIGFSNPQHLLLLPRTMPQKNGEDFWFLMDPSWITNYETLGGLVLRTARNCHRLLNRRRPYLSVWPGRVASPPCKTVSFSRLAIAEYSG